MNMTKSKPHALAIALLALLLGACGQSTAPGTGAGTQLDGSRVADATITGPITGGIYGHALWDSWYDLGELGYVEEEYFISGSAKSYPETTPADYTTRIIVRRPADAARFNGTVLLDWVNVTAQFENAVNTLEGHQLFHRDGYAYVHVSAQAAGVCCVPELTPKMWDPIRYAPLSHPGDDYAFDMFSQIAKAVRAPVGTDPMGGLRVQKVIAMGQSQSASRLHGYVTQVQRDANVIDGFLIHSGGGRIYDPPPAVPVLQLFSEFEFGAEDPSRVSNYRAWEIAGAGHTDFWVGYHQVFGASLRAVGGILRPAAADEDMHNITANYGEQLNPIQLACVVAGSQFPVRYLVSSGIHYLNRWVRGGAPPPEGARYAIDADGALMSDEYGNALGGIRLPPVEVPVAYNNPTLCALGGITVPFTDLQMQQLYPTHADYFCKTKAAIQRSVDEGFMLPEDAAEMLGRADGAKNRFLVMGTPDC